MGIYCMFYIYNNNFICHTTKKSDNELKGLVYALTPKYSEEGIKWYQSNATLAIIVGIVAIILSIIFW